MEGRHSVSSNTAAEIVDKLGGSANIESLTHCATRLRFTLHDASGVQQSDLEAVPGVMGAVPQAGDRYQVVIGGGVQTVYNEIKALPGLGGSAGGDDAVDGVHRAHDGAWLAVDTEPPLHVPVRDSFFARLPGQRAAA